MKFFTTGDTQVHAVKCCVLFDPSDGAICHVHHDVTLEGAQETPDRLLEETTLKWAKQHGVDPAKVELLHVDAAAMKPGMKYVVDLKTRRLVPKRPE